MLACVNRYSPQSLEGCSYAVHLVHDFYFSLYKFYAWLILPQTSLNLLGGLQ